ncbi:MAG: acyl carrier protein [Lachnospiraceae bacterium]|nr:acyl carrier protein [Lachnospiraceae bacterium]
MMLERIRSMIAETFDMDMDDIKPESTWEDIGLDSLDMVDIVIDIENEYDIEMPDDELENIRTVGELASYVQSKMDD